MRSNGTTNEFELTNAQLQEEILRILENNPGAMAREIAAELSVDRRTVNQYLHRNNGCAVDRDENFRWYCRSAQNSDSERVEAEQVAGTSQSSPDASSTEAHRESESAEVSLIAEVLDSLRKRLLDLTSRNRLLNFRHPKGSSIRIIDELPDQLKRHLTDDDNEMRFIPVPDPTRKELLDAGHIKIDPETGDEQVVHTPDARDWAQWLGLHTNYDSPEANPYTDEDKHTDSAIQTMLFPDELETRLRNMRQKANSAMEETGANILYLAVGFLEWNEQRDANAKRLAPLYMIPVRLERGKLNEETRTYEYRLSYSGEDILTNISLREKLRNDFHIALPELEDGVDPEAYIQQVLEAVKTREPKWKTRRYVTLCHLNFSKQLLYLDLDPENWPTRDALLEHPIVSQCLAGLSEEEQGNGTEIFGEEYPIDDIDEIHEKYPIIDDADSSQHSALIDAIDGKNLVIEGPPGTGKSQTITNLIAAAIANHKRVLFVAEKAAALEVVKRRLDQAGLGDFCLELHSHRSQKRRVLDDIADRIKRGRRLKRPQELDSEIQQYESLKDQLRNHATLVNSSWKNTELSIHDLLSIGTRYRHELSIEPESVHPEGVDGDSFSPVERNKVIGSARTFATVYRGVLKQLEDTDRIGNHPWYGVRDTSLQAFDQERIVSVLEAWQEKLDRLRAELERLAEAVNSSNSELPGDLDGVTSLAEGIQSFPEFDGSEPIFGLAQMRGNSADQYSKALDLYQAIQLLYEDLAQHVRVTVLESSSERQDLVNALELLTSRAVNKLALSQIAADIVLSRQVQAICQAMQKPIEQTNEELNLGEPQAFCISLAGVAEFAQFSKLVAALGPNDFAHRDDCFDQDELDQVLPALLQEHKDLSDRRKQLEPIYDLSSLPELDRLREIADEYRQAGVFSWLKGGWRSARRDLRAMRASKSTKRALLRSELPDFVEFVALKSQFDGNSDYRRLLGQHFCGLGTDVERLSRLRRWYREIRSTYGVGFGARVAVGDAILGISETLARALRSLVSQGLGEQSELLSKNLPELAQRYPGIPRLDDESANLLTEDSPANAICESLVLIHAAIELAIKDHSQTVDDAARVRRKLDKLSKYLAQWESLKFSDRFFSGQVALSTGVGCTPEAELAGLKKISALARTLAASEFPKPIAEKLYAEPSHSSIKLLKMRGAMLSAALAEQVEAGNQYCSLVDLDKRAWEGEGQPSILEIQERNRTAIDSPEWLASWLDYLRIRKQLHQRGWGKVVESIETKSVAPENAEKAILLGAADVLSREIFEQCPEISTFSGLTQEGIRHQFQEYDDKLRDIQKQRIAWHASKISVPQGNGKGRVRDYTELALLKNEINKKMRHIPLRQLIRRSGKAIVSLKPCFMMGPMSVAQYLAPGQIEFDLIVMDEASQVKPEDAIGAIARGGQLVVVGDPKQLPPTSFFDKLLDEEDQKEDFTTGQQSESILDAALTTFPARRLRWHYRSQHESLIAFSNQAFYGSDLVIFPSPVNEAPEYGVQFTRVKRGRFVNRVNREEAELIAKAVRKHMVTRPGESLGVVAMSAQQREQIERAIEQETKDDRQFRDLVDRNRDQDEPLFVKNLENVQGDERDVIYISMTYGPGEVGGKVPQRFGPINSINGWRRLNVLFTRSKKRMHVFSSMDAEDIVISQNSNRGVQAMKAFLDYAATGRLAATVEHTGRDPDSDFEVAVAAALSNHGYECQPQVGVAGYFLDIAVRDPGNPGRYLMAIECDGATYHSAKSTRDRDRLRQRILERLGWRVRRIWSTDWFNNPAGQLKPIIDELNSLRTEPMPESEQVIDEVEKIEEIAEDLDVDKDFVSTIVESGADLRARLEAFDQDVIRSRFPNTTPERRFLRSAMLDALLLHLPMTMWEFQQYIPPYLRQGTEPKEGEFIKPVLGIIYESEKGVGSPDSQADARSA